MARSLNNLLTLGFLLSASSALAQTASAPHDTMPALGGTVENLNTQEEPAVAPAPPASAPVKEAAPEALPPTSAAAAPKPSIDVSAVAAPSIEGVGTLTTASNGLDTALWKGSTAESAPTLLSWLHGGVSTPALRDLTERALLTQATPPSGSTQDWLTPRVQALIALGSDDKAEQLIAAVPASLVTDALEQTRAELTLLRGDSATACGLATKTLANPAAATGERAFWPRLNIFCKALDGKRDEAQLALDLLSETSPDDTGLLQEMVHKLTEKDVQVKALPARLTLFEVAALRLAGEGNKLRERLDAMPPIALKYLAVDTTLDPKLREKAESKAIQLGILPQKDAPPPQPPQPFAKTLAADVTTLVASLGAGNAPDADNAIIARLALDDGAAVLDCRRVQRLLTLMEPFGYRVPPAIWEKLFARKNRYDGDIPPATLVDRLNSAAQSNRKGEVILLSALILNGADVDKTSELVLLPVIKALLGAGFTKEARIIAHDAVQSYSAH